MTDIFARMAELRDSRTSFVLATVVASYPQQSVRAGAKAISARQSRICGKFPTTSAISPKTPSAIRPTSSSARRRVRWSARNEAFRARRHRRAGAGRMLVQQESFGSFAQSTQRFAEARGGEIKQRQR